MSRIPKNWPMIVSLAAGLTLAACARSEPARQSSAPPAGAPTEAGTQPAAPKEAGSANSAEAPRLVSSHGPLPGVLTPETASPGPAGPAGDSPHGELRWDAPPSWVQETPSNPMRAAQYRLPAAAGDAEDGECVVFYFGPGQGGDAASNASRWVGMFTTAEGGPVEGRITGQDVHGRKVTRVEASGTYHAMSFGGQPAPPPRPGSMMLGAIVPGGDANWFFRCAGPQKTVASARGAFDALVNSIH
ncbi:MAG TPA: hypothetical protein VFB49_10950 [Patescibacteria group bacterium]|nr:hypothetical protein [Patescibacteria group bacterium]